MSVTECEGVGTVSRKQRNGSLRHRERNLVPVNSLVFALLAGVIFVACYADVADGSYVDAYQQLENYGFPIGLLPSTVTGYDLAENGKFAVYLESKCEISIPSAFLVTYSKKISGKLSYGHLKDLSGIQVKIYYFWLGITAITVVGDDLKFEVGIISASYPIHPNFDENPECANSLKTGSQLLLDQ